MTSNYPPGVTGNEPQIAGADECEICGYPLIQDEEAKEMGWYETGPTCGDCSSEVNSGRCEDYPCCGHTDGLGCNYKPDMAAIYDQVARMMDDPRGEWDL